MLIFPPPKSPPQRRRPVRVPPAPPGPVALTLVSATYVAGMSIELTFDRAIDIDALVGSQITVDDSAPLNIRFVATGAASLAGPAAVLIELEEGESWFGGSGIHLNASAATGIVAADDGGAWAGVTNLALPFP